MENTDFTCSWESNEHLSKCFTLGDLTEPSFDDIVQVENCVCLSTTNDIIDNPCTIDIKSNDPSSCFKGMHIVSQCRLFELFGDHGAYISTYQGEFMDDFDGTMVYVTEIPFKLPLANFSLKFTRLKEKEIWIYGIYLNTKITANQSKEQSSNQTRPQNILKKSYSEQIQHFLQNNEQVSVLLKNLNLCPDKTSTKHEIEEKLKLMLENFELKIDERFKVFEGKLEILMSKINDLSSSMKELRKDDIHDNEDNIIS